MAELIDKMKLLQQIAEFGREIPKDQVIGVIARQESVEVEERPRGECPDYITRTSNQMPLPEPYKGGEDE